MCITLQPLTKHGLKEAEGARLRADSGNCCNKGQYFVNTDTQSAHFEKSMPDGAARYYIIQLTRDLFNDVVVCSWGTTQSRRGGSKSYPVADKDEASKLMTQMLKRRLQRGYVQIKQ